MKLITRTCVALLVIGLIAIPVQAAPAAQGGVCAKGTAVSIREGPGGGYLRVGAVAPGECISVIGLSPDGNWYQIPGGWVWAAPHLWSQGVQAAPAQLPAPQGAVPAAPPASATSGQGVVAESWVSDPGAAPGSDVVAYVLIFVDGAPRAGIPVQFVWQFKPTAAVCNGVTDGDGLARCLRNLGGAPPGQTVLIQISFQAAGKKYITTTSVVPNGDCDPAYPDFCLARGSTVKLCRDIPYRNFLVLPPDPHHFDPDGDGIGCEQ